jgi:hypothetical protein
MDLLLWRAENICNAKEDLEDSKIFVGVKAGHFSREKMEI